MVSVRGNTTLKNRRSQALEIFKLGVCILRVTDRVPCNRRPAIFNRLLDTSGDPPFPSKLACSIRWVQYRLPQNATPFQAYPNTIGLFELKLARLDHRCLSSRLCLVLNARTSPVFSSSSLLSPHLKSAQSPAQICSTLSSNLLDLKSRPTQCYLAGPQVSSTIDHLRS